MIVPMSIQKAMILNAQPYMLTSKIKSMLENEASKGCQGTIFQNPVELEPPYCPLTTINKFEPMQHNPQLVLPVTYTYNDLQRLQIWNSKDEKFDWNRSEYFIKQCSKAQHRLGFEIIGNVNRMILTLLVMFKS